MAVADRRTVLELGTARQLEQLVDVEPARGHAHGQPLVHQGGQRRLPAVADLAQALRIGHAHVGEEHLVEVGAAGDLLDRPRLDTRALHVQEEHGQPLVLGHIGVGAGDDDAPVAVMRAGGPDLLAVDDPVVAVALRLGADARDVGTGGRLGEELAPDLLAVKRRLHVALELVLGRVGHHRGNAHAQADVEEAQRYQEVRFLLLVDHLLDRRAALTAIFLRPGDARVAGGGLLGLPLLGRFQEAGIIDAGAIGLLVVALALGVGLEPFAHLGAEGGFLGGIVEVHGSLPCLLPSPGGGRWRAAPDGGCLNDIGVRHRHPPSALRAPSPSGGR